MFISGMMAKEPVTIHPDAQISEARELMQVNHIRHLPVVDGSGALVGILTDRDMRDAMPSILLDKESYEMTLAKVLTHTVREIMTKNPQTIPVYYTIEDTLMVLQKKKVGALPVVDEDGGLLGILSTRDLLASFIDVIGLGEPGTLLCILADDRQGQMKKIIDIITEEKISFGSVLVARHWDKDKRAIFPYLLTNNVMNVKKKLLEKGYELIDPMKLYLSQISQKK
ncbi:MAG: CBS and ACT domain-containing protein [Desulfocapsaceae bacterium]|nr:CBS and ACT domain-containing protein [Desulfocapsaceae bacterium]